MSLKIWLPLDGDLRNLGTSDVEVINNGATVDDNGKIGKCYNTTNGPITINNLPNPSSISISFWMKRTANTNTRQFMFTAWNGVTCELTTDGTITWAVYRNNYPTITASAISTSSGWVHYCGTFSPTNGLKLYINGELKSSNSNTTAISWSTTSGKIGKYGSYASASMLINDFRIYDHCLSAAEVHEIAMGLVLHYKLDGNGFGNRNYLKTIISSGLQVQDCNYNYDINTGTYTLTVIRNVGNFQQIWNTNLVTNVSEILGKQMIISCEDFYTTDPNSDIRIYLYYTPTSIPSTRVYKGQNTVTIPSNATQIGLIIRCDQKCNAPVGTIATFKGIKLESGDKATKWFPAEEDLGIDTTIITDSSGYGHNGEINGTLTTSSDTAKYTTSTVFNGSSYITIPKIFENNVLLSEFTWAGWVKRTYTDMNEHAVYNGITYIRFRSYNNNNFLPFISWYHSTDNNSSSNSWVTGSSLPENTWAHIAFTFKNGVLKYYYNGIYSGISDRSSTGQYIKTNYGTIIGSYGTSNYWIGNLSDVRVYTTQLLDTDIKLLYNMGMKVNNLGGIHTFEFNENSNEKLLKTGVLQTNELEETSTQLARLQKDKGWLSSEFIEI